MAPEVRKRSGYTRKCDIWSIGIIAHALLSGAKAPVFENPETTNGLEFPDKDWNDISEMAKDFIRVCLEPNPSRRPSAAELAKLKWLQQDDPTSPSQQPCCCSKKIQKLKKALHLLPRHVHSCETRQQQQQEQELQGKE
jgi:serine/threonine protein kinase